MTHYSWSRAVLLLVILLVGSCSPNGGKESSPESAAGTGPAAAPDQHPALLVPQLAHEQAPDTFYARFQTTKGEVVIEATRDWAPLGVDRFYNLVRIGFFKDAAFFRAVQDFIVQFGVNGDPAVTKVWSIATIPDDPLRMSNQRGYLSFAQSGANSRTTQLFISLKDNPELDASGFVPVARVISGMDVVDSLYTGYGELYPAGHGPRFQLLNLQGNAYLRMHFPKMDYVESAEIVGMPTNASQNAESAPNK